MKMKVLKIAGMAFAGIAYHQPQVRRRSNRQQNKPHRRKSGLKLMPRLDKKAAEWVSSLNLE
jgi:hypothetical protein